MKLVLLLVVLIAAFTVNCRKFPDGHPKSAIAFQEQALPPLDLDHELTGNGPERTEDTANDIVYQKQKKNVKGSKEIKLRGKKDNKVLAKLVDKLSSLEYKLTQAKLELNTELKSIRNKQNNITDTIANTNKALKMEFQVIKKNQHNITDSNTDLKIELQDIGQHQVNITDTNRDLKEEIESVMKNINDSNSQLKTDVSSLKQSLTNSNSVIISKLNSLSTNQGCQGTDMFRIRSQCFKVFRDTSRNWASAQAKCKSEKLILAEPTDENAPLLRKYMVDTYGSIESWLGAKGDGSKFVWQYSGKSLFKDDYLFDGGRGSSSSMSTSYCLELDAYPGGWSSAPGRPFDVRGCSSTLRTLCEVL